jgi:hypothetical protein
MKISNEMRKVIWDAYEEVEFKLKNLKSIVQNESEITDEELQQHAIDSSDLADIIIGLHNDIARNCK